MPIYIFRESIYYIYIYIKNFQPRFGYPWLCFVFFFFLFPLAVRHLCLEIHSSISTAQIIWRASAIIDMTRRKSIGLGLDYHNPIILTCYTRTSNSILHHHLAPFLEDVFSDVGRVGRTWPMPLEMFQALIRATDCWVDRIPTWFCAIHTRSSVLLRDYRLPRSPFEIRLILLPT